MKRIFVILIAIISLVVQLLPGQTNLTAQEDNSVTVVFTEVAADVGLGNINCHSSGGHSLGVNWIDLDVDGWADLFIACGGPESPSKLFLNNRDGTFRDVSDSLPELPSVELAGSVAADYDNDGDVDIYIYTDNDQWVVGDMDLDGPANLLLKNLWVENGNEWLDDQPNFEEVASDVGVDDLADEPFGEFPGFRTKSAGWLDYDRDGCVDLFVGHFVFMTPGVDADRDRLYQNSCEGSFKDVTASSGVNLGDDPGTFRSALAFIGAHLDQDMDPDMYVVNASALAPEDHEDFLYRNNGDGTFTELTAAGELPGIGDDDEAGMGIDVADIDLDGDWDIYITDAFETIFDQEPLGNVLYLNNGDGTFADNSAPDAGVEAEFSFPTVFFDIDQDGYEDLFVGYAGPDTNLFDFLYMNNGDGTFTDVAEEVLQFSNVSRRGAAVADFDRDGDLDLITVDDGGPDNAAIHFLQFFRNDSVNVGNWIQLKLIGCESNRDAIGAVVKVEANSMNMMRQIKGGMSFNSQNELVVHFGLGDTETIDKLEVSWPSGLTHEFNDIKVNKFYVLTESSSRLFRFRPDKKRNIFESKIFNSFLCN